MSSRSRRRSGRSAPRIRVDARRLVVTIPRALVTMPPPSPRRSSRGKRGRAREEEEEEEEEQEEEVFLGGSSSDDELSSMVIRLSRKELNLPPPRKKQKARRRSSSRRRAQLEMEEEEEEEEEEEDMDDASVQEALMRGDAQWVQCEDCHKWRRIPLKVALSLKDDDLWRCRDNVDRHYNRCSVLQDNGVIEILTFSRKSVPDVLQGTPDRRRFFDALAAFGAEHGYRLVPRFPVVAGRSVDLYALCQNIYRRKCYFLVGLNDQYMEMLDAFNFPGTRAQRRSRAASLQRVAERYLSAFMDAMNMGSAAPDWMLPSSPLPADEKAANYFGAAAASSSSAAAALATQRGVLSQPNGARGGKKKKTKSTAGTRKKAEKKKKKKKTRQAEESARRRGGRGGRARKPVNYADMVAYDGFEEFDEFEEEEEEYEDEDYEEETGFADSESAYDSDLLFEMPPPPPRRRGPGRPRRVRPEDEIARRQAVEAAREREEIRRSVGSLSGLRRDVFTFQQSMERTVDAHIETSRRQNEGVQNFLQHVLATVVSQQEAHHRAVQERLDTFECRIRALEAATSGGGGDDGGVKVVVGMAAAAAAGKEEEEEVAAEMEAEQEVGVEEQEEGEKKKEEGEEEKKKE